MKFLLLPPNFPRAAAQRGFTQVEMFVSLAVLSILTAAMAVGAITIQRSFQASQSYTQKEADQMRLLDYLAVDLRNALTVQTDNATGTIQLALPDYYQTDGTPREPHIVHGMAYYGDPSQPVHVSYSRQNGMLVRQEGSKTTAVAKDVQDFNVAFRDEGQVIEVSVSFVPTFQNSGGGNRPGTTTICRTLLRNKRQS